MKITLFYLNNEKSSSNPDLHPSCQLNEHPWKRAQSHFSVHPKSTSDLAEHPVMHELIIALMQRVQEEDISMILLRKSNFDKWNNVMPH